MAFVGKRPSFILEGFTLLALLICLEGAAVHGAVWSNEHASGILQPVPQAAGCTAHSTACHQGRKLSQTGTTAKPSTPIPAASSAAAEIVAAAKAPSSLKAPASKPAAKATPTPKLKTANVTPSPKPKAASAAPPTTTTKSSTTATKSTAAGTRPLTGFEKVILDSLFAGTSSAISSSPAASSTTTTTTTTRTQNAISSTDLLSTLFTGRPSTATAASVTGGEGDTPQDILVKLFGASVAVSPQSSPSTAPLASAPKPQAVATTSFKPSSPTDNSEEYDYDYESNPINTTPKPATSTSKTTTSSSSSSSGTTSIAVTHVDECKTLVSKGDQCGGLVGIVASKARDARWQGYCCQAGYFCKKQTKDLWACIVDSTNGRKLML